MSTKEQQVQEMTRVMAEFIAHIAKKLPDDVETKIQELAADEKNPLAKTIYETMKTNQDLAFELNRPSCQDTGVRLIVGKGGMGPETARACKEFGALHCVFPAGNAVLAATEVEAIESANWRELGMPETLWTCRVKEFGPLIVSIDATGDNYFENKKIEYNAKKEEVLEDIYKHVSFIK